MELMDLPDIMLHQIFKYMTFDEVSKLRLVCTVLNEKCKDYLNRGFAAVEHFHAQCLKDVKSQLPRRESERRCHSMARHCDVLNAMETRVSMLTMTYSKYMDAGLCCFIPGKVLDEMFRVLRFIKGLKQAPPRTHELLQELRDISSMAMEHFDEKIAPSLKEKMASTVGSFTMLAGRPSLIYRALPLRYQAVSTTTCNELRTELIRLTKRGKKNRVTLYHMKKLFLKASLKTKRQHCRLVSKIHAQSAKIAEQDSQIAEMRRQHVEWDQKIADLTVKINKVPECSKVNMKSAQPRKRRVSQPNSHEENETPTSSKVNAQAKGQKTQGKNTKGKKPRLA